MYCSVLTGTSAAFMEWRRLKAPEGHVALVNQAGHSAGPALVLMLCGKQRTRSPDASAMAANQLPPAPQH
jgi:hypothetical protein